MRYRPFLTALPAFGLFEGIGHLERKVALGLTVLSKTKRRTFTSPLWGEVSAFALG